MFRTFDESQMHHLRWKRKTIRVPRQFSFRARLARWLIRGLLRLLNLLWHNSQLLGFHYCTTRIAHNPNTEIKEQVMETPELWKTSQILQKGFYTLMTWFFRHLDIEVYRKRLLEILFSHFHVTRCDLEGHMISSFQVKLIGALKEAEFSLKRKI